MPQSVLFYSYYIAFRANHFTLTWTVIFWKPVSADAAVTPHLTRASRSAIGGNQKVRPRRNSRYYAPSCMSCSSARNFAKENAPINGRAYVRLTLTISRISPHLVLPGSIDLTASLNCWLCSRGRRPVNSVLSWCFMIVLNATASDVTMLQTIPILPR